MTNNNENRKAEQDMTRDLVYTVSKDQLNLVLSFFSRLDSKLSVLLAIDTGMLAVLGTDAPPLQALSWAMIIASALTVLLLGTSIARLFS